MYRVTMVILKRQALHSTHPVFSYKNSSRWWFQIQFIFTPNLGEMIQFDGCIFFRWVGKFNHQLPVVIIPLVASFLAKIHGTDFGIDQGHSGGANAAGDWGCQVSLPETNSNFAPEKWMVGRRVCFLLGWPIFQVLLLLVSGRGSCQGNFFGFGKSWHSLSPIPWICLDGDGLRIRSHGINFFVPPFKGELFSKHWRSKSKILPQIVSISILSLSFDDIPKVRRPHLEIVQFDCHMNERFLAKRIQRIFFLMVM